MALHPLHPSRGLALVLPLFLAACGSGGGGGGGGGDTQAPDVQSAAAVESTRDAADNTVTFTITVVATDAVGATTARAYIEGSSGTSDELPLVAVGSGVFSADFTGPAPLAGTTSYTWTARAWDAAANASGLAAGDAFAIAGPTPPGTSTAFSD